ncbi:epoxyqueuosine reductase [Desulfurispira natronophila]|uniref:Epoxyqueuosine reductase QueG n=1 Tax=Desulfurispira natronophila TaxID=682562 RepID=A0A7W7Y691_9BACT|nr:epoxyqueuosine reductase [Desulfurispira natronophila]MBB5022704.1 epoxyqueuosine reductase QueG [Desulfurispira natronophila]
MQNTVIEAISYYVSHSPYNLHQDRETPYFDAPLVGFAAADDPLFANFKQIIGDFHLTPRELLPQATTVISWVLPIVKPTRMSNRRQNRWPSQAWAHTRGHGESFNNELRRHMVSWLEKQGYQAVAPQLSELWQWVEIPDQGPSSRWSERHIAYTAGLGTFSLNDGLITPVGIAHRVGSVVTSLSLPPTPRTAKDYRENCLWYREGTCGLCIRRCPVEALSPQGHDKLICNQYVYNTVQQELSETYGVDQPGCGLCQTAVPCETRIPASIKKRSPNTTT